MKEYKTLIYNYHQKPIAGLESEINELSTKGWTIFSCQELGGNQYILLVILERFKTT